MAERPQNLESLNPSDDSLENLPVRPKRRIDPVLPEKQKRKFQDGTPRSQPAQALRGLIKKVQEVYKYAPLGPDEDIRLLIVEKGRGGEKADAVRCRLLPSALPSTHGGSQSTKAIRYEALSYYWGQEDPSIPITILTYNSSALLGMELKKFWIRPNLHAALVQLRSEERDVALWVDAICINQDDKVEKTAQVSRMHEIYSEADSVCIWLGVGEADPAENRQTFHFIRQMLNLRRLDQLIGLERHAKDWFSFVKLMRNRWFSRRWVVQELALAKEATVHYGEELIQWTDFRDAVALFVTKHDEIKSLLSKSRVSTDPDPTGDMRALGANTLVEATSNLFRRSDKGEILERLLSLETLVSTLLAFEATDPRDTIYAVLSIANDTPYSDSNTARMTSSAILPLPGDSVLDDHRITPNYDKTLAEIYTDFIDYCVEKSKSLDIICRHWAPVPKGKWLSETAMPTWVSLISGSAFGEPESALQGRSNGDSLVGTPSRQHHKHYNASANLQPLAKFGKHGDSDESSLTVEGYPVQGQAEPIKPSHEGYTGCHDNTSTMPEDSAKKCNGVIFVKGMILDTIGKLSPRAPQGMILQESLEMGGWSNDNEPEKVPDSLWRTLVADRGPDGRSAPSWYYRACLECLTEVTQNGDLSTGALIENPNTPSTMVKFLTRVQQVVWNRKFLRSKGGPFQKEEKLFGLAPTKAKEGDHICILFGCSVPVILREFRFQNDLYFQFVGESYIHGMMDGEAISRTLPSLEYPYEDSDTFKIK